MSEIVASMVRGSAWLTAARVISNGLAFCSTIVLARLLSPEDFGLVALATSIQMIALAVTELSLSQALVQHRDPNESHFNTVWTLGVIRGVFLAFLLCVFAPLISRGFGDERLEFILYAIALSVFIAGLGNPRFAMLQRQLIFKQEAFLAVLSRTTMVLASITVAVIWKSYWALIVGVLASQIVASSSTYLFLPYLPRFSLQRFSEIWSFSVWLTLGKAINTINWRFDHLLVGGTLGQAVLGIYSTGSNLAQLPTREALAPLNSTFFPAFSRIADDPQRLRDGYRRGQAFLTFAALPIGLTLALIADPLIVLAMGEKWRGAIPVVQVLTVVFALQTLGSMVTALGMATGNTRLLFVRDIQMFFVRLPIIIVGTIYWGLPGLLVSRAIAGLFATVVNMFLVRRLIKMSVTEQFRINRRNLFAALVMILGTIAMQLYFFDVEPGDLHNGAIMIAVSIFAGLFIYFGTVFATWAATGRAKGPETELIRLIGAAKSRLKEKLKTAA